MVDLAAKTDSLVAKTDAMSNNLGRLADSIDNMTSSTNETNRLLQALLAESAIGSSACKR